MGLHAYPSSVKQMQTNQVLIVARCNDVYARRQINLFYFGSHNSTPGGLLPSFFSGQPYLWFCLLFSWKLLSLQSVFPLCSGQKLMCNVDYPEIPKSIWAVVILEVQACVSGFNHDAPAVRSGFYIHIYMHTTPRVITCRGANGDSACQAFNVDSEKTEWWLIFSTGTQTDL